MLLWEMLGLAGATGEKRQAQSTRASIRLPYETRCAMMTKAGRRLPRTHRQGERVLSAA